MAITKIHAIKSTLGKALAYIENPDVNPVNRLMLSNAGRADRSEAAVRSFNQYMKANLSSAYTYIDMYSYLKSTGYSFASDHYGTGTVDDGLHYTTRTYKRIFAKCMDSLRVPA